MMLEVDLDSLDEEERALIESRPASWAHPVGQCPTEVEERARAAEDHHSYLVGITVWKDGEVVAEVKSDSIDGPRFTDISETLAVTLNERWLKVLDMGSMIDG